MYVCVCNAVTEAQVYEAIEKGAKSVKDLNRELGVGSECGSCVSCARQCLKEAHRPHLEVVSPPPSHPVQQTIQIHRAA